MKLPDTSTVAVSPPSTVTGAIVPTARGARFGTVTLTDEVAWRPPGSRAVIVMVALPGATAVMLTELPCPDVTVATDEFDELAEYDNASPFASLKQALTVVDSPTLTVTAGRGPHDAGA